MTDVELIQLRVLLSKLKVEKPELTVLVAEIPAEEVHDLMHNNSSFYCDMLVQIEICLSDKLNDNLR